MTGGRTIPAFPTKGFRARAFLILKTYRGAFLIRRDFQIQSDQIQMHPHFRFGRIKRRFTSTCWLIKGIRLDARARHVPGGQCSA